MSPRARGKTAKATSVELSPSTEKAIREGAEAIRRGDSSTLTREELDRWAETGEFPEAWLVRPTSRT